MSVASISQVRLPQSKYSLTSPLAATPISRNLSPVMMSFPVDPVPSYFTDEMVVAGGVVSITIAALSARFCPVGIDVDES